jgi:hypothetical protein
VGSCNAQEHRNTSGPVRFSYMPIRERRPVYSDSNCAPVIAPSHHANEFLRRGRRTPLHNSEARHVSILFPRSFEWNLGGRSGWIFVPKRVRRMRLCGRRYAWTSGGSPSSQECTRDHEYLQRHPERSVVRASIVVERHDPPHRMIG